MEPRALARLMRSWWSMSCVGWLQELDKNCEADMKVNLLDKNAQRLAWQNNGQD